MLIAQQRPTYVNFKNIHKYKGGKNYLLLCIEQILSCLLASSERTRSLSFLKKKCYKFLELKNINTTKQ